jgi:dTDP-4-amino-4,6-dideoxygalactose transaminase
MADLAAQHAALRTEIDAAIGSVLDSGGFVLGPTVESFEKALAQSCGSKYAFGVGNGTDALLISLKALGVGPGDEVITPPFTFVATVETVALLGATPVFADIDPDTFNLDVEKVKEKLGPKTRAILPVHLFGQLAEMEALQALADAHGIPVLADGAQAIGATRSGRPLGAFADITTLSFYPTKNLGAAGDGGAILTDDDALAERIKLFRFHGSGGGYLYKEVGLCSRLDALQAAILSVKLPQLSAWTAERRDNACFYRGELDGIEGIVLPICRPENVHAYHQFTLRVPGGRRDALKAFLAEREIATGVFYPQALHLAPAYAYLGAREGDFPESERACEEVLSIPVVPELTKAQLQHVATSIREFFA